MRLALRGLTSLRARAILVVVAVVASPLAFVVVSNGVESIFARRTATLAATAAEEAAAAIDAPGDRDAAIDAIARAYDQRIRVVGLPDGGVIVDRDHLVARGWTARLGDLVYGPDRAAVLASFDAGERPLLERPESIDAVRADTGARCEHSQRGSLFICSAARRTRVAGGPALVHAEGSSRRALQTLYDARRDLVKLTLFVLALGVALGAWMGKRMVRPIERLRAEVLSRARAAVPRADLTVARTDEVGDLATAFNTLVAALEGRARANEAFLADLAHELKSPIASVRACADRLADGAAPDEARARRLGEALRASSVRLDALVTQFLELARAESGLPDERREPIDVVSLARGVARAFELDGRRPTIAVIAPSADADDLTVAGVPSRIESVLRNLLDNALAFSEGSADGSITVTVRADESGVEIVVADRGPGIAAADLPRVFNRFFTTRGDRRGTGLGLALTRAIVEAHGGRIHAESSPGEGARFVVHLPRT